VRLYGRSCFVLQNQAFVSRHANLLVSPGGTPGMRPDLPRQPLAEARAAALLLKPSPCSEKKVEFSATGEEIVEAGGGRGRR